MKASVRPVIIIAINTFREIIRDRILYGIAVFALLLFGLSAVLGQLSFAEQARISADFGFTGIQIGASLIAIFAGGTLVSREIEKQTVLTLLVRPLTRPQFLVGKFLGLTSVVAAVVAGLAGALAILVLALELKLNILFLLALLGVFLEAIILIALAIFFGSFAKPTMTIVYSLSFFLIGHWVQSLHFFVEKSKSPAFKTLGRTIAYVVPDLERFNWRSAPVYDLAIPVDQVLSASAYALGWVLILLALTALIFRRRDFV